MVLITIFTGKFITWIEPKYKRIRELVAELNTQLSNNLSGPAIIKTFDRYEIESARVDSRSEAYRNEKIKAIRLRKLFFAGLRVFVGLMFAAVLLVGGGAVVTGTLTAGTFVVFFMYLRELDGTVEFTNVHFEYGDSGHEVLSGIDLSISENETIGFAGPSGSGKSTLLNLIPRLYDVDAGSVTIDGRDVKSYDLPALRDNIGIVEQDPYIFSGSIRENIAYGNRELFWELLDGDLSAENRRQIENAARDAGAHEFICSLPEGYDTEVGERGVKLSGGQRQRVSIARMMLNDPVIVILDEATSDVDTETEEIIQGNLSRICADRVACVIAHRLSTIQHADRIVVMNDGEIIESGTHDSLVSAKGTYANLWESQSSMRASTQPAD